jgi:hypothetical protein
LFNSATSSPDDPATVSSTGSQPIYAIYEGVGNHAGRWVVIKWVVFGDLRQPLEAKAPHAVVTSLQAARASIPRGLRCSPRTRDDLVSFVELWV